VSSFDKTPALQEAVAERLGIRAGACELRKLLNINDVEKRTMVIAIAGSSRIFAVILT
jgi:hypothetical protein